MIKIYVRINQTGALEFFHCQSTLILLQTLRLVVFIIYHRCLCVTFTGLTDQVDSILQFGKGKCGALKAAGNLKGNHNLFRLLSVKHHYRESQLPETYI